MVDVGSKDHTHRTAIAAGEIIMLPQTLALIEQGNHKKGDVLGIARIAGIMASKKTLCHPVSLTHIEIIFEIKNKENKILCQAKAETVGQTGVEMEALCAVQNSLLTIYDMCKAVDRGMQINKVRLLEKAGGKSGHWKSDNS